MNDTLELIDLESLLNDECKCESQHIDPENRICSETVTHLNTFKCSPKEAILICFKAAQVYTSWFGKLRCEECLENIEDCWSIVPV